MSIHKLNTGWQVRYRVDGAQRKKSFRLKRDAELFEASQAVDDARGLRVEAAPGMETVGAWLDRCPTSHLKATTAHQYRTLIRLHIRPRWGGVLLRDVKHGDVSAWVGGIEGSPSLRRQAHRVLSICLDLAVRDGAMASNPAHGVKIAKAPVRVGHYLTVDQVHALADKIGIEVHVLAFCGLRFGEASALRVQDVDVKRRRLLVHRSATEVGGQLIESDTKSHAARSIALPPWLAASLADHLKGREPGAYALGDGVHPLRLRNWRRVFDAAAGPLGIDARPHDLRHTAASLMIASGASVKTIQRALGHASAAMTLDVYGHLMADEIDGLGAALDRHAPRVRPDTSEGQAEAS